MNKNGQTGEIPPSRRKLRTTILVGSIPIVLASISLVMVALLIYLIDATRMESIRNLETTLRTAEAELSSFLALNKRYLCSMAEGDVALNKTPQTRQYFFSDFVKKTPQLDGILILNEKLRVKRSYPTASVLLGNDFTGRKTLFKKKDNECVGLSALVLSPFSGRATLTASRKIGPHWFLSFLLVDELQEIIKRAGTPGTSVVVYDINGRIVFSKDPKLVQFRMQLQDLPFFKESMIRLKNNKLERFQGKYLSIARKFGSFGWTILVATNTSNLLRPVYNGFILAFVGFIVSAIVGVLFALLSFRSITQPIAQLNHVTQDISKGNYTICVPDFRILEIAQLRDSFVSMVNAVKKRETQLAEFNKDLEKTVALRTYELSKSIEKLKKAQARIVREEKASLLSTLIRSMQHELNTPLGTAITASTLQQDIFEGPLTLNKVKTLQTASSMIVKNLVRIRGIMEKLNKLNVDLGETQYHQRQQVDISELWQRITKRFQSQLPTNIKMINAVKTGFSIMVNEFLLEQVLVHLVENSIRHAFPDNQPGKIILEAEQQDQSVEIRIRDTGVGLRPEKQEHLFNPTGAGVHGMDIGVGLYLSYLIVGGPLSGFFEFTPLKPGVQFSITIPK